jgi:hypothetical protein
MESAVRVTPRFAEAVDSAREVHFGLRKGTQVPYMAHLLGVASVTRSNSFQTSGSSPTGSAEFDFRCENHGSIFLLRPLSESAKIWVEENLPAEAQWFGDAVVVEHRYIWAILAGIQNDGLVVAR